MEGQSKEDASLNEHADFQSNAALALAKRARTKPADLAAVVLGSGYPVQFSAGREPTTGPPALEVLQHGPRPYQRCEPPGG
jgi:hypothetical protein